MKDPRRRDLRLGLVALVLLAVPAIWFAWSSRDARQRREAALAGVPDFPAPRQVSRRRPPAVPRPAAAAPPQAAPAAPRDLRADRMTSFVLAPSPSVSVVHVNALFNTPLFERLRACMPDDFRELESGSNGLGIDITRDVDQVAMIPGGAAISGFFEGKPVARKLAGSDAPEERSYRGQTILSNGTHCVAQMGNLIVISPSGQCEALIDRALTPPPVDAAEELYGDLYFRSDLRGLREAPAAPEVKQLIDALQGMTVRANVWDSVALTLQGAPRESRDAQQLAQMARGALAVIKGQLDDEDVELRALADLAQVDVSEGKLELNLALPAQDLFDRLHFPCAGRDGG